jgi:hypothetical protein
MLPSTPQLNPRDSTKVVIRNKTQNSTKNRKSAADANEPAPIFRIDKFHHDGCFCTVTDTHVVVPKVPLARKAVLPKKEEKEVTASNKFKGKDERVSFSHQQRQQEEVQSLWGSVRAEDSLNKEPSYSQMSSPNLQSYDVDVKN